jgi:glycosyltransferase involved in cell wall biosynthesis
MDNEQLADAPPAVSVVIATYNDWFALAGCLESLSNQTTPPSFEVIIVDDGSDTSASESIMNWGAHYHLKLVRQEHSGVAAARNFGIQQSSGSVLLFTDADCRLATNCLSTIWKELMTSPERNYFQLRLVGGPDTLIARAEELRLSLLQSRLSQADGSIQYLNTAGFAIRRDAAKRGGILFNPVAKRAEDTLLMIELKRLGELPVFVRDAVVKHAVSLSFWQCIRKDIRSAREEQAAYEHAGVQAFPEKFTNRERLRFMVDMWRVSVDPNIGRMAWFVVVARQALRQVVFMLRWAP